MPKCSLFLFTPMYNDIFYLHVSLRGISNFIVLSKNRLPTYKCHKAVSKRVSDFPSSILLMIGLRVPFYQVN